MAAVTSIFARRVVQAAGDSVDGAALLRAIGLAPEAPYDVNQWIDQDTYFDLLERVAREMENGYELPTRVGPLMRPDDYGALGLALKAAPTIRQSLERVERFARLWTDTMAYEVIDVDDGMEFRLHRFGERRLGMRLSNEMTVASAVSLMRQTSSPRFRPRGIYLQHPAPETITAHERYFGCPVHFGADRDAVSIAGDAMNWPNRLADDGISKFLVCHLESAIAAGDEQASVKRLVRQAVSRSLTEGVPKMAEIARRLGMSERTLQRRLADDGLSFKAVLEATRRELAENLLRQSKYALSEVAFLTGFSEQSAFTRAFRRWTGQPPAEFRRETTGLSGPMRNCPSGGRPRMHIDSL